MRQTTTSSLAAACLLLAACQEPQTVALAPEITPSYFIFESQVPVRPTPAIEPTLDYRVQTVPTVVASAEQTEEAEQGLEAVSEVEEEPLVSNVFKPGEFLGEPFTPGTFSQRTWYAGETFYGSAIPTPVLVASGAREGPTLCLTAAVHGDELNGIEAVRQVMYQLEPDRLAGNVIGVPIVNLQGFQRHSRYLPDRRDLNRFFPGNQTGSSASRMAFSFFREVIMHCDGLVDLHTGSFHRTNLPQLRANLHNEDVVNLTAGFGSTVILHSEGAPGTLRHAAVAAGIPAVTLEAGEPMRINEDDVEHAVKGIFTLLDTMGMYGRRSIWGVAEPVYYTATWLRADTGGILASRAKLGKRVKAGDLLGTVTDPITNDTVEVRSPHNGRVIGMAVNQFVMPGFAIYHLGLAAPMEDAVHDADSFEIDHSVAQLDMNEDD